MTSFDRPADGGSHWSRTCRNILAIFVLFALYSFCRYPLPGPNEPHYLGKAKHYWDPAWCGGDLFFESSNAHLVFYQTFGLLTRVLSLDGAAIAGRMIGFALLAAGWTRLVLKVVGGRWTPLWSACLFLAAGTISNLSGEWLVRGIESKVVAYALLFWALALFIDYRTCRCRWRLLTGGLLLGAAISFHPVVGIWAAVSAAMASMPRPRGLTAKAVSDVAIAAMACALAAVPGVLAAARATGSATRDADYIQVYYRLAHHLDPMTFPALAWCWYAAMIVAWLILRRWLPRTGSESRFARFVMASGLIALGGLAVGLRLGLPEQMWWHELRWKVLKYYSFRLFDVLVPLALAMTVAALLERALDGASSAVRRALVWIALLASTGVTLPFVAEDARPLNMTRLQIAQWRDVCEWVQAHVADDALVMTPPLESWAFKWFAERAELVSYKDCPQDARGILEWNDRLLFIRTWAERQHADGYSREDCAALKQKYGVTHIISRWLGPFAFAPVYDNGMYRVHAIDE